MSEDRQLLIDAYFDDVLSTDELRQFEAFVKESPEFARRVAAAALLHDRLRAEIGFAGIHEVGTAADSLASRATSAVPWRTSRRRWVISTLVATAALVLISFLLPPGGPVAPVSAASIAVDRIIEAARRQIDRVYRIRITDYGADGPQPQVPFDRGGIKPNVDGAELYVRGEDQFVLARRFADGTLFVTGSDGEIGWAVPPTGHVHLSRDVKRFRRAVPGERDEIPFLDLTSVLETLRRDYDLDLIEGDGRTAGAEGWSRLDAHKRPHVRGGAERVQLWFDGAGTAHRISLQGLPKGEPDGSPQAVELELMTRRDVPPNCFHHEAHHADDRPLAWE